jgi:restriction endonuclease S subunit
MFHKETDFQDTPIGKTPKEWRFGKLVEFSKTKDNPVQTGPFGAQLHASDYAEDGVPLILIKNVLDGQITDEGMPRVAETKAAELTRYRLRAGDIVFSRVGSVGRASVIRKHQEGWLLSGQMLRVRLENPEIDSEFLGYAIATAWFQKALASRTVGATRKSINTEILSNLPMVVPPRSEQRGVVGVLGVVDSAIGLVDRVIWKTERLKKGLMQELLTKGIGHKEYKDTQIGKTPNTWQIEELGEMCNQRSGIVQPSGEGTNRFIGLEHIASGETTAQSYGSDVDIRSSKFRFYPKDILYGKLRPYLDKAVLVDFDGICSTDLLVLTAQQEKTLPEFLVYVLHSSEFIKHAIATTTGTNHPRTSWKAISKFEFGFPPLPEQRRISEILFTVNKKLELEKSEKARLERVKRGLMDLLLTGKVRVKGD